MVVTQVDGLAYPELAEPHWFDKWLAWDVSPFRAYVSGSPAVSILRVFNCFIRSASVELQGCGVGGVFTRPQDRKQGHATKLLRWFLGEECPQPVCVLTASTPGLYEKLGFEPLNTGRWATYALVVAPGLKLRPGCYWELKPTGF